MTDGIASWLISRVPFGCVLVNGNPEPLLNLPLC
jgi:hypothetical protein